MSPKGLKIALAVSLALNLFLLGAIVAGLVVGQRAIKTRMGGHPTPLFAAARALPEADQARLREQMRGAALAARADFRQAREARRRAVELASAPTYDREAVRAALRQSHAAEVRGRTRLDDRLTEALGSMQPEARKALAPSLARGLRGPRRARRDDIGPPPGSPPPH